MPNKIVTPEPAIKSVHQRIGDVVAVEGDYSPYYPTLAQHNLKEDRTNKGIALGYAPLDASGRIPPEHAPPSMTLIGGWDAAVNVPDLISVSADHGDYWIVTNPGSFNLNGITTWNDGDWALWSDVEPGNWIRVPQGATVSSVFGRTGAIDAQNSDYSAFYDALGGSAAVQDNLDDHTSTVTGNPHNVLLTDVGGAPLVHTHVEGDITDLDKYTRSEVDTKDAAIQTDLDGHKADPNPHSMMKWLGPWAPATFSSNDVVIDGEFTMVAITNTADRPAPQPIGAEEIVPLENTLFESRVHDGIVKLVHRYTSAVAGWHTAVRLKFPVMNASIVVHATIINLDTGASRTAQLSGLPENEWVDILIVHDPKSVGVREEIQIEYYKTDIGVQAIEFDGRWILLQGTVQPGGGVMNIDSLSSPTSMRFAWNDQDSVDQEANLRAIEIDQILRIRDVADGTRHNELTITGINTADSRFIEFSVEKFDEGTTPLRTSFSYFAEFELGVSGDVEYFVAPNYFTTEQVETELYFDGVKQPVSANDCYAILTVYQPAYISPDWQMVAHSGV